MPEITALGIDPGLEFTGYALVGFDPEKRNDLNLYDHGVINTPKGTDDHKRLRYIYKAAHLLVQEMKPDYIQVEKFFIMLRGKKGGNVGFDSNAQKMNQVIGALLAAIGNENVIQVNPGNMRLAVTNKSDIQKSKEKKTETQRAVSFHLGIDYILEPNHIADAAGHAIHRIFTTSTYNKSGSSIHARMPLLEV